MQNNEIRKGFITLCLTKGFTSVLNSLFLRYKRNIEIANLVIEVISTLAESSKEAALCFGQEISIKTLLCEIKNIIRSNSIHYEQDFSHITANLKYLLGVSGQLQNINQIVGHGGLDVIRQLLCYITYEKDLNFHRSNALFNENTTANLALKTINVKTHELDHISQLETCAYYCMNVLSRALTCESITEELFSKDLLDVLQKFLDPEVHPNLILQGLKLIDQAGKITKLRDYLLKKKSIDQIIQINITYLHNQPIQAITGRLIEILGGNSLISSAGKRFIELSNHLDSNDDDLIKEYVQNALYVSSLLLTSKNDDVEGTIPFDIIKSIDKTLPTSKDNMDLVRAQMLVLKRIVNRDQSIKEELANSALIEIVITDILGNEKFITYDDRIKIELLDTIKIFITHKESSRVLSGKTGEEFLKEEDMNAFLHFFLQNNGLPIQNLITIGRLRQGFEFCQSIKKTEQEDIQYKESISALSILGCIGSCHRNISCEIVKKGGVKLGLDWHGEQTQKIKSYDGRIEGAKLLQGLAAHSDACHEILKSPTFTELLKKISKIKINSLCYESEEIKLLKEEVRLLRDLCCDVTMNMILLNDFKCVEVLISFTRNFIQNFSDDYKVHSYIWEILAISMDALRNLVKNPLFVRTFTKENGVQETFKLINILAHTTSLEESHPDTEELAYMIDLSSSNSPLNQAIEETLAIIESITRKHRYNNQILPATDDQQLYQSLLNLVSNRVDDPIISFYVLKIFHRRLVLMAREDILESLELFMPICDLADTLIEVYPNIEIISQYGTSLKGLICSGMSTFDSENNELNLLCQEKVQNIAQKIMENLSTSDQKDTEIIENLCKLMDIVKDLLTASERKDLSEDEYMGFIVGVSTLRDLVSENKFVEIVRRHDIVYSLSRAILNEKIDEDTRNYILQILQMIFSLTSCQ